jgi:hypothetical protein
VHARQVEDAVHGGHPQRRPPVLPRPAGRRIRVQHDEVQPGPAQEVRAGQSRLTGPDHHHIHARYNAVPASALPDVV